MTEDLGVYSGLKLLPVAVALLDLDGDPFAHGAVTVERVRRSGYAGAWEEDEVTIDWGKLFDPRRSHTAVTMAQFARSILDGTPVSLREMVHFQNGTYTVLMQALARGWPDPPPAIDAQLGGH